MAISPKLPKGTRDFSPKVVFRRRYIMNIIEKEFSLMGYQPIATPSFELVSTLLDNYGDEGEKLLFRILNSGDKIKKADIDSFHNADFKKFVDSLSDKALRYDLTVPFSRYVAQNQNDISFPFKRYQIQPVWRADRPQKGRFQEFYQCDADVVGTKSLWHEIELIQLYDCIFTELKLPSVRLIINHRKIIEAIIKKMEINKKANNFITILDKLDKISWEEAEKELTQIGLTKEKCELLLKIKDESNLKNRLDFLGTEELNEGVTDLRFIENFFDKKILKNIQIEFNPTLARGLSYYTGTIFEVLPPQEFIDLKGQIGSIGGGGRYDGLLDRFGMKNISGVGMSFGFERLYMVLEELNLFPNTIEKNTQIMFINFGEEYILNSWEYIQKIRDLGVRCELYPTNAKIKKQIQYINQRNIPYAILIGEEEIKEKKFIFKNMEKKEQKTYLLKDLSEIIENTILF